MSCDVQTSSTASNPSSATASRDFATNGTSTSAPGLVTSSRRHSTANSRPTSRRRRDNPSPAGTLQARGRLGGRARRTRCRRARGGPARNPDQHHRQPGRLLDGHDHPRSSPATSSASSSATPAGRRGSRPARHAPRRRGEHSAPSTPGRTYGVTPRRFGRAVDAAVGGRHGAPPDNRRPR